MAATRLLMRRLRELLRLKYEAGLSHRAVAQACVELFVGVLGASGLLCRGHAQPGPGVMGERARAPAGVRRRQSGDLGAGLCGAPHNRARRAPAPLGVLHDVEAPEESAFLLTIAWPGRG